MTNLTPCGFDPTDNDSPQTLEQQIAECAKCTKLRSCSYASTITTKMVKKALEDSRQNTSEDSRQNMFELANDCQTFAEFHERVQKETVPRKQTRSNPKNLNQIARESLSFTDYQNKALDA